MLWAPGMGNGYPFPGRQYQPNCTAYPDECAALDTDGDGKITQKDDMYSPYWPGPDSVDWVGMSLYWWGAVSSAI